MCKYYNYLSYWYFCFYAFTNLHLLLALLLACITMQLCVLSSCLPRYISIICIWLHWYVHFIYKSVHILAPATLFLPFFYKYKNSGCVLGVLFKNLNANKLQLNACANMLCSLCCAQCFNLHCSAYMPGCRHLFCTSLHHTAFHACIGVCTIVHRLMCMISHWCMLWWDRVGHPPSRISWLPYIVMCLIDFQL